MFRRSIKTILLPGGAASALIVGTLLLTGDGRAQDASSGKMLFEKRCGGCHSLDRDKEGPRLAGVYGRTAGASPFAYSEALKKSGIKWTDQTLDQWLADPDNLVPNNDMSFHVDKPAERRAIIDYLKQNSK